MTDPEAARLRLLVVHEPEDRLRLVAQHVAGLGHEVIAAGAGTEGVAALIASERPDVALVGLGESAESALAIIEMIASAGACPVVALIHSPQPAFVERASERGAFAYIRDRPGEDWQGSIDIVLRRFAEYRDLERAFGRRALTERAKGILMERHSVDDETAFDMLRDHSRAANRKLVDVAAAVVDGHRLLPRQPVRLAETVARDPRRRRRGPRVGR